MNSKFPQPPKFSPPHLVKNPVVQRKPIPVAPPPYRPQPVPRVLQTKMAVVLQPVKPAIRPVAPPVYRPNPAPKIVQAKPVAGQMLHSPQMPQLRPAPPVKAPVLMSTPLSLSDVLQLSVKVQKGIGGKYTVKGRPKFQNFVTGVLVDKWNDEHDPSEHLSLKGLNLTHHGLARCHKTSWSDIRGWVARYVSKEITKKGLTELTDALYGEDAGATNEWKQMNGLRKKLFEIVEKKSSLPQIQKAVSQLCSALNSATPNLRLDDSPTNSKIQEHADFHVVPNPKGKLRLSPNSRRQRAELKGEVTTPLRTPKGKHMFSSSVSKPFGKADSTPKTGSSLFD